ncbi:hypothetical protein JD969_15610 [Planctomycetota bacterium]|nr:hypothetical protein JD969_15610 [Planctomycetota bacterium]
MLKENLDRINEAITKKSLDITKERPLPLYSYWSTYQGNVGTNSNPDTHENREYWFPIEEQIEFIKQGYPIIPVVELNYMDRGLLDIEKEMITLAAEYNLPICILCPQWERELFEWIGENGVDSENKPLDPYWKNAEGKYATASGGLYSGSLTDMKQKLLLSPFASDTHWYDVGRKWSNYDGHENVISMVEEIYPCPPQIIFVSNNEHPLMKPGHEYLFGPNNSYVPEGEDAQEDFCLMYASKYSKMIAGIRDNLPTEHWRRNTKFIGYNIIYLGYMGQTLKWNDGLTHPNAMYDYLNAWDGESESAYLSQYRYNTDHSIRSVQIECMNSLFKKQNMLSKNNDFWFETSIFDGCVRTNNETTNDIEKLNQLAIEGRPFDRDRYIGLINFMLWLNRPRTLRGFGSYPKIDGTTNPFLQIQLDCVKKLHQQVDLHRFWKHGTLIENTKRNHPYQKFQLNEYPELKDAPRFYLLECDENSDVDWNVMDTETITSTNPEPDSNIQIFAIALSQDDEVLIYAHSPYGLTEANVELPDLGKIKVSCAKDGVYTVINKRQFTTS